MFCPSVMLLNARWGYISVECGADYRVTPRRILWNPLRWEIGIGPRRPCLVRLNRGGRAYRLWSNFQFAHFPTRKQRELKANLAAARAADTPKNRNSRA